MISNSNRLSSPTVGSRKAALVTEADKRGQSVKLAQAHLLGAPHLQSLLQPTSDIFRNIYISEHLQMRRTRNQSWLLTLFSMHGGTEGIIDLLSEQSSESPVGLSPRTSVLVFKIVV